MSKGCRTPAASAMRRSMRISAGWSAGRPMAVLSASLSGAEFPASFFSFCGTPMTPLPFPGVGEAEGPMARYYFHIKDGPALIKDQEGTELSTAEEARAQALRSARELWADASKSGRELGADAVVIADEHGRTLTFVPMTEALPKRSR